MKIQIEPDARDKVIALLTKRPLFLNGRKIRILFVRPNRRLFDVTADTGNLLLDLVEALLHRARLPGFGRREVRLLIVAPKSIPPRTLTLALVNLRAKFAQCTPDGQK